MPEQNFWEYVSLLPCDGAQNATAAQDFSISAFNWVFKAPAKLSTIQSKFRTASLSLDGATGYLAVGQVVGNGGSDNVSLFCTFATDFMLDAWVWVADFAALRVVFGSRALYTAQEGPKLYFNGAGNLCFADTGTVRITGATVAAAGVWHHVRALRTGGSLKIFLNGLQEGATVASTANLTLSDLLIGASYANGAEKFKGFIAEVRVARAAVVNSINFVPPGVIDTSKPAISGIGTLPALRVAGCDMPATTARALSPVAVFLADVVQGGNYRIAGTVLDAGTPDVPVSRRVRLHRRIDGAPVRETWSAANGSYSFNYLANQLYYVTAFDHAGNENAVIKDAILPELMP